MADVEPSSEPKKKSASLLIVVAFASFFVIFGSCAAYLASVITMR